MRHTKTISLIFTLLMIVISSKAQDEPWRENIKNMTYSPRYFGPNAFPLPELRNGTLGNRMEAEVRGEYHIFEGDEAKDIFGRLLIPIAEGRAGLEVGYHFYEYYTMTQKTVEERHAAGQSWKYGSRGDVIFSSFYKILKNNKWVDLLFEASLKTASGDRIADARHTDAATYWFDINAGVDLFRSTDSTSFIRLQGLTGFYCWMTNDIIHRQNDAFLYSAGLSSGFKNLVIQADIVGFHGYLNNGDRPLILRTKLDYAYKKNILSFRYKHGMNDFLYDTYSLAYIRLF